MSVTCTKII